MLQRAILLTCLIGIPYTITPQAQTQQAPQQQPDPQEMYIPSQEEMEEILNQLSPEEQEELANLGREIIENASEEDLQEISQYLGISPDELRAEVLGPQEEQTKQPEPQKSQPQQPNQQKQPDQKFASVQEVEKLLVDGTNVLGKLIQKADLLPDNINKLESYIKPMQDIVAYLKIIRNTQRAPQLASVEHKDIVSTLQTLIPQLQQLEPQIDIPEETDRQTPYDVLGLTPDATQETIEQQYQKLKAEKSPENVEARLQEQDASPRQIRKAVREARIAFKDIQEAYNTLRDAKMREQLRREQKAQQQKYAQMERTVQDKQNAVISALNTAIQNNNLVSRLEAFLQSFAPQELEKKKQLEKAEEEQRKAQRERERQRPPQASGQRLEPRPKPPQQPRETRGGAGQQAPTQPGASTQPDQKPERGDKQDGQKTPSGKPTGGTSQKKDTDKQQKQQKPGRAKKTQQEQKQQQTLELLRDELTQFSEAYKKHQSALKNYSNLTQQLTSRLSQEQQTKLQNTEQQIREFAENANIQNISARLERVTRTLVAFTQEQYDYWKNNISPYIKELEAASKTIGETHKRIKQLDTSVQQNETVQSAQKTAHALYTQLQPVTTKLQEYNKLISQNQSVIYAFGTTLQQIMQYYDNNPRTVGNISENIQNLSNANEQEIDTQVQNYSQHIQNMLKAAQATENKPDLNTLITLLQEGDLPQEQYPVFKQNIGKDGVKKLKTINEQLQSAYNTLTDTSQFPQDTQNRDAVQKLITQLKNAHDTVSRAYEVAQRIQQEIERTPQAAQESASTESAQAESAESSATENTNGATEGNEAE